MVTEPRPRIRLAVPADAAALAEFAARMFSDTFGAENDPADLKAHLETAYGLAQQSREIASPDYITLIAESGSVIAGYAQVRRSAPPAAVAHPHPVEIYRFYVDTPWHGSGLARRLMDAALDAALDLGGAVAWLSVWERNPRARAFYAKCGFIDVGETTFMVGADRQRDRVLVARAAISDFSRGQPLTEQPYD
jgi:GNAT superfamily N-acetyltransferase